MTARDAVALRKKLGITQAEYARLSGVSLATVARWEGTLADPGGAAAVVLGALARGFEMDEKRTRRIVKETLESGAGLGLILERALRGDL